MSETRGEKVGVGSMGIGPADRPESRRQVSSDKNKKKEAQAIEDLAAKQREEEKESRRKEGKVRQFLDAGLEHFDDESRDVDTSFQSDQEPLQCV